MAQLQSGHQVQLLQGGLEFFAALIADIDLSAHEVRFETYIFNTRGEGDRVAQALERHHERMVPDRTRSAAPSRSRFPST